MIRRFITNSNFIGWVASLFVVYPLYLILHFSFWLSLVIGILVGLWVERRWIKRQPNRIH